MAKFIIVMLLIAPWIFLPLGNINDQFRLPQSCVMDIMFLGVIVISFLKGNNLVYRNKYLGWLLGWLFLNFLVYFFIPFSIDLKGQGRVLNTIALEPMIHIFLGVWALQAILSNFEREDFFRVSKALCISSVIMAGFAILQYIGYDPMKIVGAQYVCGNKVSACLDNPNLVGNYLALCLPLFFVFKDIKYGWGAILVIAGIYVTHAHLAQFLAVLSAMLYFLIRYRHDLWAKIFILKMFLLGSFLVWKFDFLKLSTGMDGRLPIWQIAIEKIKLNPIFGSGIGVWKSFFIKTYNGPNFTLWTFVHNDWLELAVQIGLVGVILLILVIVNSLRRFSFENENLGYFCMFTTFLVMMIGSFPWEVATIATLGLISFAAAEKL